MGLTGSRNSRGDSLFFPPEIIIKNILKHLSIRDKLIARQVCRDWNNLIINAGDQEFIGSVRLVIEDSEYCDDPLRYLSNGSILDIPWTNFLFRNLEINKTSSGFWTNFGERISRIEFYDCSFPVQSFNEDNQKFCPNLTHLSLVKSDKYLMMGKYFFRIPELFHLEKLKELDISRNKYLNDYVLFSILLKTNELRSLNLSDTQLTFSTAVHKRFYPGVEEPPTLLEGFSEYLLSFQMIHMAFLKLPRGQHMVELIVNETRINDDALNLISDPETFKWESLELKKCTEIKVNALKQFLDVQKGVKKLKFKRDRIKSSELSEMNLASLEHLTMKECDLSETSFLHKCPNLKHLDLSFSAGIKLRVEDLSLLTRLTVLRLRSIIVFYNLDLDENNTIAQVLMQSFPFMKNLVELDIGHLGSAVNNQVAQCILKNLKRLKILRLCKSKITDWGLTGGLEVEGLSENDSTSLNESVCLCYNLKDLKVLSLAECFGLGEATWSFALRNMKNLTMLNLSGCVQMSISGIRQIIGNCCSLEDFNITETGLKITGNEELIEEIRNKLFRLRKLKM